MMQHIIYTTDKGHEYPLEFFYSHLLARDLSFKPAFIRDLCRVGCANYGRSGGCPPRAPLFDELYRPDQQCWLLVCKFSSEFKPERVKTSKNSAIHWKFQDGILARLMNSIGWALCDTVKGSFLGTGYCMGCPGKKCSFKLGAEECRNPVKRTFSLESTGINVVKTLQDTMNIPLYWYSKGKTDIPYMAKSLAFFPTEIIDEAVICKAVENVRRISLG